MISSEPKQLPWIFTQKSICTMQLQLTKLTLIKDTGLSITVSKTTHSANLAGGNSGGRFHIKSNGWGEVMAILEKNHTEEATF